MPFREFDYGILVQNAPHACDHFRHLSSEACCDPTNLMMMVMGSIMITLVSSTFYLETALAILRCISSLLALMVDGHFFYLKMGFYEAYFSYQICLFKGELKIPNNKEDLELSSI